MGQRAGGEAGAGPEAPSRRGAGAHLGQNKGRTHLRRRRGLGRAARAYLGLRGSLRGSVRRAGRSQDGTMAGRGQADESQRRSAGTASRSGRVRAGRGRRSGGRRARGASGGIRSWAAAGVAAEGGSRRGLEGRGRRDGGGGGRA